MSSDSLPSRRRAPWLPALAAVFSFGAAALHFLVMPEHFREWWGYGLFFLAVGSFQGIYAIGLLNSTLRSTLRLMGECWYALLGVLFNLLVIGVYLVTRTVGIPFFGPRVGEVEAMGGLDLSSKALELVVVAMLAVSLWQYWSRQLVRFRPSNRQAED